MPLLELQYIKMQLLICSAILLCATSFPAVVKLAIVPISDQVLDVIINIISSYLGSVAVRLNKNENLLVNKALIKVVGHAIGTEIFFVVQSQEFPNQEKVLRKLVETAINHWQDIAELRSQINNELCKKISEKELLAIFSSDIRELTQFKVLTPSAWTAVLNKLSDKKGIAHLPSNVVEAVSEKLYNNFPKALQKVLKDDLESGGKAFAGILLSLLSEIKAEITARQEEILKRLEVLQIPQAGEVLGKIIEGLESFIQLKVGTLSAEIAFKQLARQMGNLLDEVGDVNNVNTEEIVVDIPRRSEIVRHLAPQSAEKKPKIPFSFSQRLLRVVLPASCTVTIFLVVLRFLGILQPMELKAFDWLMRWRPDEGQDERLLVVAITEEDIQAQDPQESRWSISDRKLNQLLAKLDKYKPRAIGLDLYRESTLIPELETRLKQHSNIFGVCKVSDPQIDKPSIPAPPEIPKLRQGFSDVLADGDGVVRRHLLEMELSNPDPKCSANYAFSLQLASHYLQSQLGLTNGQLKIGDFVFQPIEAFTAGYQGVDARGYQVLLNYRTHEGSSEKFVSQVKLGEVLNSNILDTVEN